MILDCVLRKSVRGVLLLLIAAPAVQAQVAAPESPNPVPGSGLEAPLPAVEEDVPSLELPHEGEDHSIVTGQPVFTDKCPPCEEVEAPLCECGCDVLPGDHWFQAGYAYIWTEDSGLRNQTLRGGAFNSGNTAPFSLFGGNDDLFENGESGFYLNAGHWFDECKCWGITASFLYQADQEETLRLNGALIPRRFVNIPLATGGGLSPFRPDLAVLDRNSDGIVTPAESGGLAGDQTFVVEAGAGDRNNVNSLGQPAVAGRQLFDAAGVIQGGARLQAESQFYGGDVALMRSASCYYAPWVHPNWYVEDFTVQRARVDWIGGFRYFNLEDQANLTQTATVVGPGAIFPAGTQIFAVDRFLTQNDFYGALLGLRGELLFRNGVTLGGTANIGIGFNDRKVKLDGNTIAGPRFLTGGLLTSPDRIGGIDDTPFSVMPQIGVNVGYLLNEHIRLLAGYQLLLWTDVVRVGDQIPDINRPAAVAPVRLVEDSIFWAQALTTGVEVRF